MAALALDGAEVTFPGRAEDACTAVRDTTLHVANGEFLENVDTAATFTDKYLA